MTEKQIERDYRENRKTIGDAIEKLASEFSKPADISGLYILEMAHIRAKQIRSQSQRWEEAAKLFEEKV
jgi:replicative DNA helicase